MVLIRKSITSNYLKQQRLVKGDVLQLQKNTFNDNFVSTLSLREGGEEEDTASWTRSATCGSGMGEGRDDMALPCLKSILEDDWYVAATSCSDMNVGESSVNQGFAGMNQPDSSLLPPHIDSSCSTTSYLRARKREKGQRKMMLSRRRLGLVCDVVDIAWFTVMFTGLLAQLMSEAQGRMAGVKGDEIVLDDIHIILDDKIVLDDPDIVRNDMLKSEILGHQIKLGKFLFLDIWSDHPV
ncbi:hypothetical protein IEQ34_016275 [Dendrobium chrysotoxum]|uniref:Uncharacterized protein n=1 Tax=Dendrobium chrysotoxum TaxID=161865 RepID=A0AAV7GD15_DENCH|nr:hypothetical protein IEQ34_016275 [Dendrobium chrysotoxum]